jgi:hypothetical protein
MPGIAVAESPRKSRPKVLAHIEIHPVMGGGHIVKHVYTSYEHEPKEVKFNDEGKSQGGEHIMSHLVKHAGLAPMEGAEGEGDETANEEEAAE